MDLFEYQAREIFAKHGVPVLDGDVAAAPLVPVRGSLPVGRVSADPSLLDLHAASPERVAWWRDRVTACTELLREEPR